MVEMKEFERNFSPRIHDCQLFVTINKGLGIVAGNCQAQDDDQVWALEGCKTHFILRPAGDKHRLISPCFFRPSNWSTSKKRCSDGTWKDNTQRVTLI